VKTVIEKSHYEVLGVPPGVSVGDLRAAYIQKAHELHPDTRPNSNAALFASITEAYAVLRDPARRRAYDAVLGVLTQACADCDGTGIVSRTRGFTRREESPCKSCDGRGRI
jgi:DnaJ-class molecular chaperone